MMEDFDINFHKNFLKENGYTIIHNVYNIDEINEYKDEFFKWYNSIEDLDYLHNTIHGNGILKFLKEDIKDLLG